MLTIKKCLKCGALVEVLHDCTCENCGVQCCGDEMKSQLANTVDAAVEKHLPVVEVNGNEIVVVIPHVMEADHYIEWIAIVDEMTSQKQMLVIGKDAKACFPYKKGAKVYSYCNKHGLWSTEVK